MTAFKDHFSGHAADYANFRPNYPPELFDYLASISPGRELAWDCATGNGQAAVGLAAHFDEIIATDASAQQIENARPHLRISYRVAENLYARAKAKAKAEGRTVSEIAREALERFVGH